MKLESASSPLQQVASEQRSVVGISILDEQVQGEIAKHGSAKDFHIVLWRQVPDATGSNWNAHIARIRGDTERDPRWWQVVPELRLRFNLD